MKFMPLILEMCGYLAYELQLWNLVFVEVINKRSSVSRLTRHPVHVGMCTYTPRLTGLCTYGFLDLPFECLQLLLKLVDQILDALLVLLVLVKLELQLSNVTIRLAAILLRFLVSSLLSIKLLFDFTNLPIRDNQSINEPINQSINEPINQSINQPINQNLCRPDTIYSRLFSDLRAARVSV